MKRYFLSETQLKEYIEDQDNHDILADELPHLTQDDIKKKINNARRRLVHFKRNVLREEWQISKQNHDSMLFFIKSCTLPTLHLCSTLNITSSMKSDQNVGWISLLGFASGGFEDANIVLKGLQLVNIYEDEQILKDKIYTHYKNQALNNLSTIVSSLKIFGNPAKFFKNIGSSIDNLTDTTSGFDPVNVATGTAGVLQTGVAGTFGALSNITDSVGGAISLISFDDEWVEKRAKKKAKPVKGFLDGVKKGGGNFFGGILDGVTGIVEKPLEGAGKGGIGGFFSGIGKGVVGFVSKPVTGLIDAVSTTTEGIKNSIKDEEVVQVRERSIRCFYGKEKSIRNYSSSDSFFQEQVLSKKDHSIYIIDSIKKCTILQYISGRTNRNNYKNIKCYIGVSNKMIAIQCFEQEMVIIHVNQIIASKPKNDTVILEWSSRNEKHQILVKVGSQQQATKLFNLIGTLQSLE